MKSVPHDFVAALKSGLWQEGNVQANNPWSVCFGASSTTVPVFNVFVK
jgi:hypothetical protein